MMTTQRAVLFGALVLVSEAASAHGGGLNAEGCHNDRKNGGYHCHRGPAPRRPANSFAPTPAASQRLTRYQSGSVYFANCSAARAAGLPLCGGVIPAMRGIWIGMAMAWGANERCSHVAKSPAPFCSSSTLNASSTLHQSIQWIGRKAWEHTSSLH